MHIRQSHNYPATPASARLSQSRHPRVPTQPCTRPMRHTALRRPSHPNADGRQLLSKSAPDRSTPLALPRRAACGPRDCAGGLIPPGRGSLVGFRRSVRLPRDAFIREYVSNVPQKQPFSIPPGLFFSDNSSSVRELIKPAGAMLGSEWSRVALTPPACPLTWNFRDIANLQFSFEGSFYRQW